MRRIGLIISGVIVAVAIAAATAWASLALWYRLPTGSVTKGLAAGVFVVVGLSTLVSLFGRLRLLALAFFIAPFGAILLWWNGILPERTADWAPDVARQVTGRLDGEILTLTNIRDFEWHTNADFSERWSSRSYDLAKLRTLDLFLSYWAGPEMAHTILSFGFDGGEFLAFSIEVRRRKGGEFSPIADLFKSNPLVIIAADERDVIRVRSNVRHEDVQLYRLRVSPERIRPLLLEYVADSNALADAPRFYNSITTNCTTTIVEMMRVVGDALPLDWRLIVNGYLPDYAYARGALDMRLPLSELKALAHIDRRAAEADSLSNFSELIRVGVPNSRE